MVTNPTLVSIICFFTNHFTYFALSHHFSWGALTQAFIPEVSERLMKLLVLTCCNFLLSYFFTIKYSMIACKVYWLRYLLLLDPRVYQQLFPIIIIIHCSRYSNLLICLLIEWLEQISVARGHILKIKGTVASPGGIFALLGNKTSKLPEPKALEIRNKYFVSYLLGVIVMGVTSTFNPWFPGLCVLAVWTEGYNALATLSKYTHNAYFRTAHQTCKT